MEGWLPFSGGLVLLLTGLSLADGAHREHKVHNIVLYPDKHSWCQTLQIKQVISYPGCKSEEIDNNVCVGACFSYSIPHTEPSDPGEVIVPYCDSCQPSDTTWHHVTLECQENSHETPPQLVKRVQIINNCSCSSCERTHQRFGGHHASSLDADETDDILMMEQNDVPDLLKILNNRNETNSITDSTHTENMKAIMNHKIVTLLQNIQEKNSQYDKQQLIELLRMIQGPSGGNHKMSDKHITDFVESLNSENIQLDLSRMREVLARFEHAKYLEKHRKYLESGGLHDPNDNRHHHHQQQQLQGLTTTSQQSPSISSTSSENQQQQHHHQHHHHHHHHHDSDADDSIAIIDEPILAIDHHNDDVLLSPKRQTTDPIIDSIINHHTVTVATIDETKTAHHLHHHHVGEQILGHGHLTKGPNGALVIEPDRIHEKLDVNPHELKPNHAGTLLSYSGQSLAEKNKSLQDDDVDDVEANDD